MKNPSQMSVNDLCLLSRQKITKTEEHKDKRAQDVYCLDRRAQRQGCSGRNVQHLGIWQWGVQQ